MGASVAGSDSSLPRVRTCLQAVVNSNPESSRKGQARLTGKAP